MTAADSRIQIVPFPNDLLIQEFVFLDPPDPQTPASANDQEGIAVTLSFPYGSQGFLMASSYADVVREILSVLQVLIIAAGSAVLLMTFKCSKRFAQTRKIMPARFVHGVSIC